MTDASLKAKASKVAEIGTFYWVDATYKTSGLEDELKDVPCSNILGIVVKNLPKPYCGVTEPPSSNDITYYKTIFIDGLVTTLKKYPNVAVAIMIEPGALANIILGTCDTSYSIAGVREGLTYAMKALNLPNVITYLDVSHGGILGWTDTLKPTAAEISRLFIASGSPKNFRGIATNVASYNAFSMHPGEFEPADDASFPNKCLDEQRYISYLSTELKTLNFSNHAVTDTSRNAVQGLRQEWTEWCNVNGAGFGVRPTGVTGDALVDAFVWVKDGGESDGTSDVSSSGYDKACGIASAFKPSPVAGAWNEAYFEMLLKNAKPAL